MRDQAKVVPRYRGTSLIRNNPPAGPYSWPMHMVVIGGGRFLMNEVPLYLRGAVHDQAQVVNPRGVTDRRSFARLYLG